MDRAESALAEAGDVALSCLGPDEAMEYLCRLQRLRAQLDAMACQTLVALHLSPQPLDPAPGRSVATVVAAHAGVSPRGLTADQRLGTWLLSFRCFAHAFSQGRLSRAHVQELRKLDNIRTRWQLVGAQDDLLEMAETLEWSEFVAACRYWLLVLDPDGREPRDQVESRSCNYRTHADGTVTGRFRLDALAGATLSAALDQQVQRLFREDSESGDVDRTASQRRADALVQLLARGARSPEAPIPGPLVHIVMSLGVAEDLLARTAAGTCDHDRPGEPGPSPLRYDHIDGRCELIDGTPLHPRLALGAVLTGTLRRMVLGPGGEIIDLGRKVRSFPPHLKQALLVRARGRCQVPGCAAPRAWLQADHVVPWTHHGPTALHNGQILCDPHNDPCNTAKRDTPPPPSDDDDVSW